VRGSRSGNPPSPHRHHRDTCTPTAEACEGRRRLCSSSRRIRVTLRSTVAQFKWVTHLFFLGLPHFLCHIERNRQSWTVERGEISPWGQNDNVENWIRKSPSPPFPKGDFFEVTTTCGLARCVLKTYMASDCDLLRFLGSTKRAILEHGIRRVFSWGRNEKIKFGKEAL